MICLLTLEADFFCSTVPKESRHLRRYSKFQPRTPMRIALSCIILAVVLGNVQSRLPPTQFRRIPPVIIANAQGGQKFERWYACFMIFIALQWSSFDLCFSTDFTLWVTRMIATGMLCLWPILISPCLLQASTPTAECASRAHSKSLWI